LILCLYVCSISIIHAIPIDPSFILRLLNCKFYLGKIAKQTASQERELIVRPYLSLRPMSTSVVSNLSVDVQYRSKVLVHKQAAKPRPPPFCFPRICCSGTKTATSVRTKTTEHLGLVTKQ